MSAKKHFPEFAKPVFADQRFASVIDDGMKYVAKCAGYYRAAFRRDHRRLYRPARARKSAVQPEILRRLQRLPERRRRSATQNGCSMLQPRELLASVTTFRRLFADGTCYLAAIPTDAGGHMAMGFATDDKRLRQTRPRRWPRAIAGPAASQPNTGRPRFTPPHSHCRVSLPIWWLKPRVVNYGYPIDVRIVDETTAHHENVFRWAELRISPVAKMLYKPCQLACFWEEKS